MITDIYAITVNGDYREMRGLSTDTKPTNVANGSTFDEMDTGKRYMFDEEANTWQEV